MSEAEKRIEALAKVMFDAWEDLTCRTAVATEQAVRRWEDADQWDMEGFRQAARTALIFLGFDPEKPPLEGFLPKVVEALQATLSIRVKAVTNETYDEILAAQKLASVALSMMEMPQTRVG